MGSYDIISGKNVYKAYTCGVGMGATRQLYIDFPIKGADFLPFWVFTRLETKVRLFHFDMQNHFFAILFKLCQKFLVENC